MLNALSVYHEIDCRGVANVIGAADDAHPCGWASSRRSVCGGWIALSVDKKMGIVYNPARSSQ